MVIWCSWIHMPPYGKRKGIPSTTETALEESPREILGTRGRILSDNRVQREDRGTDTETMQFPQGERGMRDPCDTCQKVSRCKDACDKWVKWIRESQYIQETLKTEYE